MRFSLFVTLLVAALAGCTSRDSRTGSTTPTAPAVSSSEATPPPYEDPNQSTVPDPSTQQHPPLGPEEPLDQPPLDQPPQPQSPAPTEDPNDPNRDPSQPRKPTTPQPQPTPTPQPPQPPQPLQPQQPSQPDPYSPMPPP